MMGDWWSASGAARLRTLLAASLLLLAAFACAPQPLTVTREPATLRLVAASSCEILMQESAMAYEEAHPWVTVTSEVFNNALALDALEGNEADLALLSWGSGGEGKESLWMEPVARDGIAVIVHPASTFSGIDLAQLREIFHGRVQERQGVVLTIVSREDGSGTRAAFESLVLDGQDATLNAVLMPSNEAVVDYVASTPAAIGYASTCCVDDRVRALPVEGVPPTEETIASGSYPLCRERYLASSGEPTGEARQFAQWLLRGGGEMANRCPVGDLR
jgi:phosphate transport system substrate-binding protein